MYKGHTIIKGGFIYVSSLDETYSKEEVINMPYKDKVILLSFLDEKELTRISYWDDDLCNIV